MKTIIYEITATLGYCWMAGYGLYFILGITGFTLMSDIFAQFAIICTILWMPMVLLDGAVNYKG